MTSSLVKAAPPSEGFKHPQNGAAVRYLEEPPGVGSTRGEGKLARFHGRLRHWCLAMMSTTATASAHKKLAITLAVTQPNAEACGDSGMGNPLSAAISTSFSIVANGGMTLAQRWE